MENRENKTFEENGSEEKKRKAKQKKRKNFRED